MKHIVFYSGGLGSWMTAKRVIERYGKENVICLFTDTLIEDDDLYRFLLETTQEMFGIDQSDLIEQTNRIPDITHETMDERKQFLIELGQQTSERNPHFQWISDGRDVWDVFHDVRFLGNSRLANCSHELKQKQSKKWIKEHFTPDECILYLGIDWTEEHRTKAPRKNWSPYEVQYPMCEEPYFTKIDVVKELEKTGVERPQLYTMGFTHNNCAGFCVRAGQGHFANLWEKKPQLYAYHEAKEQEIREYLGRDVSILSKTEMIQEWVEPKTYELNDIEEGSELHEDVQAGIIEVEDGIIHIPGHHKTKSTKVPFTLKELRKELEQGGQQVDMFDVGGCGCFVDDGVVSNEV